MSFRRCITISNKSEVTDAVQRMADFTALLYYHLTKAMMEDFGDSAKETINKAIKEFGLERGRNIAEKVKAAGEELTIDNLDKYYDMPIAAGWGPEPKYDESGRKHSCTKSCTFADLWLSKNWDEIGKIYCEVDPAIRLGYNPDIIYTPTKNILDGDSCCESITEYKK